MLSYLKKFNGLPAGLKQKVSGPAAMAALEALEKKYGLPLAALVMKVMVKEIAPEGLASYLFKEKLNKTAARQLADELREKIFFSLEDYLSGGGVSPKSEKPPARKAEAVYPDKPAKIFPAGQAAEPDRLKAVKSYEAKPDGKQPVKGASFFFSADDETEIRELAKKIALVRRAESPARQTEDKLQAVISRAQINFGSADLADRFKKILRVYLRGVRNKIETKLTLIKPFSSGGLSFDEASAQQVMDLTDKVLNSRPEEIAKPFPKIKAPLPERDAPYDFSKFSGEKKNSAPPAARPPERAERESEPSRVFNPKKAALEQVKPLAPMETSHELAPLTPVIIKPEASVKRPVAPDHGTDRLERKPVRPVLKDKIKPAATAPVKSAAADQMPLIRRRFAAENSNVSPKVKVEDVRYIPKVMSPLDEIKYLDLVNFRRLDQDPVKAALKIKDKINLLAEESYGKMLEGVKAWRSNPVNQLYLEIGHMSISENKPIDVIIEERKTADDEYLTAAEFEAIMDLNKALRF